MTAGAADGVEAAIEGLEVAAYRVPTLEPESDGTLEWESTTVVVVYARGGGKVGLGYTYTERAAASLIEDKLNDVVRGRDAMSPAGAWWAMRERLRNAPQRGLAMYAVSAVDAALWDLKARLLGLPLATLLGRVRDSIEVYASGGFTSLSEAGLREQLGGWAAEGFRKVKMKVGRDPARDAGRVRAAREVIGRDLELFTDANGAYSVAQALRMAEEFAASGVSWLEEPRPSDDPAGLARVRAGAPAGMDVAAGEYADTERGFLDLIEAGAADVLQPDITRCGGVTGLLRAAALCGAHHVPLSTHCAPALTLHVACACREVRHMEWFADHVRLEGMLFEGSPRASEGRTGPDFSRAGHGLELKRRDAERFAA